MKKKGNRFGLPLFSIYQKTYFANFIKNSLFDQMLKIKYH